MQQLIASLNQESQQRFTAAFEQIRENFRAFRKLFGGRADIILEDPANVLDCGIEIVAQPPGKELQAISLMSGGEKSMTAIALLMSIFKTRPAPCAILDEVDAALDEANNDRFNRIVREFVTEAQFIIITHSKRTRGIGDRLYGITMQEPGVSTRVSVQLGNANVRVGMKRGQRGRESFSGSSYVNEVVFCENDSRPLFIPDPRCQTRSPRRSARRRPAIDPQGQLEHNSAKKAANPTAANANQM